MFLFVSTGFRLLTFFGVSSGRDVSLRFYRFPPTYVLTACLAAEMFLFVSTGFRLLTFSAVSSGTRCFSPFSTGFRLLTFSGVSSGRDVSLRFYRFPPTYVLRPCLAAGMFLFVSTGFRLLTFSGVSSGRDVSLRFYRFPPTYVLRRV